MENNVQPVPQAQPVQPVSQAQPVQPVQPQVPNYQAPAQPMYNMPPVMPIKANNVPGSVKFLINFVAFFVPLAGYILGCLINLTSYDNKESVGEGTLKLSGTMFIVQFVLLLLPVAIGVISVLAYILDTLL